MLVHLLLRLALKNSLFSQCDSLEKNVSSFISGYQLEQLLGYGWEYVPLLSVPASRRHRPMEACTCSYSVCDFMCVLVLLRLTLVSWCPPSLLIFTLFLPHFLQGSLSHEGRDLMEIFHLGLSATWSLTLST